MRTLQEVVQQERQVELFERSKRNIVCRNPCLDFPTFTTSKESWQAGGAARGGIL